MCGVRRAAADECFLLYMNRHTVYTGETLRDIARARRLPDNNAHCKILVEFCSIFYCEKIPTSNLNPHSCKGSHD